MSEQPTSPNGESLDESDHLAFQLYFASISPREKRNRFMRWLFATVVLCALAVLLHRKENPFVSYYFLGAALLYTLAYPWYSRWYLRRHYLKHIRANYLKGKAEFTSSQIEGEEFVRTQGGMVFRIQASDIEAAHEIADYYFIRSKSGLWLIVSKLKSPNVEEFEHWLRSAVEKYGPKLTVDLDWRWK